MLLQSRSFKAQSKAAYVIAKSLFQSSKQGCLCYCNIALLKLKARPLMLLQSLSFKAHKLGPLLLQFPCFKTHE
jgi:hypothetical protein